MGAKPSASAKRRARAADSRRYFFAHTQEDFEAALASHRAAWMADMEAHKREFEASFAARKAELAEELTTKVAEKRAVKNMMLAFLFVVRLLA